MTEVVACQTSRSLLSHPSVNTTEAGGAARRQQMPHITQLVVSCVREAEVADFGKCFCIKYFCLFLAVARNLWPKIIVSVFWLAWRLMDAKVVLAESWIVNALLDLCQVEFYLQTFTSFDGTISDVCIVLRLAQLSIKYLNIFSLFNAELAVCCGVGGGAFASYTECRGFEPQCGGRSSSLTCWQL